VRNNSTLIRADLIRTVERRFRRTERRFLAYMGTNAFQSGVPYDPRGDLQKD
jgi:hypothetical protein